MSLNERKSVIGLLTKGLARIIPILLRTAGSRWKMIVTHIGRFKKLNNNNHNHKYHRYGKKNQMYNNVIRKLYLRVTEPTVERDRRGK